MAGTTSPTSIPYMTAADALAGLDEFTLSLATRLQALETMRQGGTTTITPTATGTTFTKRVTFPTSFTSGGTPKVVVCMGEAAGPGVLTLWAEAIDNTGFTLGIQSTSLATRTVRWMAIP